MKFFDGANEILLVRSFRPSLLRVKVKAPPFRDSKRFEVVTLSCETESHSGRIAPGKSSRMAPSGLILTRIELSQCGSAFMIGVAEQQRLSPQTTKMSVELVDVDLTMHDPYPILTEVVNDVVIKACNLSFCRLEELRPLFSMMRYSGISEDASMSTKTSSMPQISWEGIRSLTVAGKEANCSVQPKIICT